MPGDPLFEFAVPEDLLREAVAQVKDPDVVADLDVMPGTGEGKPPPLVGILNRYGYAPLVLLTAAAMVPGTFGNGIALVGSNLETSFHMSNASLGAVAFVAQVSQLLWAVPLALWADRGSRKVVAAVALLVFAGFGALMAISPNVWCVRLPLPGRLGGHRGEQHGAQLVPVRRLPDRGAGTGLQLAQPVGPPVADDRDPDLRLRRDHRPRLALRVARRAGRDPARLRPLHAARAGEGGQREQPHPQGVGHGPALPAGEGAPGAARAPP